MQTKKVSIPQVGSDMINNWRRGCSALRFLRCHFIIERKIIVVDKLFHRVKSLQTLALRSKENLASTMVG